jgi:hypothetical protein
VVPSSPPGPKKRDPDRLLERLSDARLPLPFAGGLRASPGPVPVPVAAETTLGCSPRASFFSCTAAAWVNEENRKWA